MSSGISINRSTQFVSLDTHPVNNALVVTYEIIVNLVDKSNNTQIASRSKQAQFQINLTVFDKLTREDVKRDGFTINLQDLSAEILRKCPLLVSSSNQTEDIYLNLLYLLKRRRSQLISLDEVGSSAVARPPSSASIHRLKSAASGKSRRVGSAASGAGSVGSNHSTDIYSYYHSKKISLRYGDVLDEFIEQLDDKLLALEGQEQVEPSSFDLLESKLEGLYGDPNEQMDSMTFIRRLSREDVSLVKISSNRLLFCAILRTLRDCSETGGSGSSDRMRNSIMYCLIRLTSYSDVYENLRLQMDSGGSSVDVELVGVVINLLSNFVAKSNSAPDDGAHLADNSSFAISLIFVLINSIKFEDDESGILKYILSKSSSKQQQVDGKNQSLLRLVLDLLKLTSRSLLKELDLLLNESLCSQLIQLIQQLIGLLRHLSSIGGKEFLLNLRRLPKFESTICSFLDSLQSQILPKQQHQSQKLLNELYHLEMDTLELVHLLILKDKKVRRKLLKRGTLKCVLRNLVVFLARHQKCATTLSPYDKSPVLSVPFKCLYELSCDLSIRHELLGSKIIIKCLFEYLLASSTDFKVMQGQSFSANKQQQQQANPLNINKQQLPVHLDTNQILVASDLLTTGELIVCIWINLAASGSGNLQEDDFELFDLLREYLVLFMDNLRLYLDRDTSSSSFIYLHLKLARNFSLFMQLAESNGQSLCLKWIETLCHASNRLLPINPLTVECLSLLSGLISIYQGELGGFAVSDVIRSVLIALDLAQQDAEYDDLLLVLMYLLSQLARKCELCQLEQLDLDEMVQKVIQALDFIYSARSSDNELLLSSLHCLIQLTDHSKVLRNLPAISQKSPLKYERLIDGLTKLQVHSDDRLARLAVYQLNLIRQLEEHLSLDESLTFKRRFSSYNAKWLQAIHGRSSREMADEDSPVDQFGQIRTMEQQSSSLRPLNEEEDDDDDDATSDEIETSDDDDDEPQQPDLNVIDANSMIKHLTTRRRQFRAGTD